MKELKKWIEARIVLLEDIHIKWLEVNIKEFHTEQMYKNHKDAYQMVLEQMERMSNE